MRDLARRILWIAVFTIPCEGLLWRPELGTIARLCGMVAAAAGVLAVVMDGEVRRPSRLLMLVGALTLWSALTLFWTLDPERSGARIVTQARLFTLVWLIWEFSPASSHQRSLLQAYVLGAYVSIGVTIGSALAGREIDLARYSAFDTDPNELGLTLALGIPMAWQLMQVQSHAAGRWLNGLYLPASVVAVFLTASRGATLATAVACSIIIWSLAGARWSSRLRAAVLLAGAAYAAYTYVPETSWQRLSRGREEIETGDLNYRVSIWRAGAAQYPHRPIVGAGSGAFPRVVEPLLGRMWASHNTYLAILVETGIVGFALFGCMGLMAIRGIWSRPAWERRLCGVIALTWCVGVISLTWEHRKPTWFVVGMITTIVGTSLTAGAADKARPTVRAGGATGRGRIAVLVPAGTSPSPHI